MTEFYIEVFHSGRSILKTQPVQDTRTASEQARLLQNVFSEERGYGIVEYRRRTELDIKVLQQGR